MDNTIDMTTEHTLPCGHMWYPGKLKCNKHIGWKTEKVQSEILPGKTAHKHKVMRCGEIAVWHCNRYRCHVRYCQKHYDEVGEEHKHYDEVGLMVGEEHH